MESFKDHSNTCGCLTSLRTKPQPNQPGKLSAQWLPEMSVIVYTAIHHVMVYKVCLALCCVLKLGLSLMCQHNFENYG